MLLKYFKKRKTAMYCYQLMMIQNVLWIYLKFFIFQQEKNMRKVNNHCPIISYLILFMLLTKKKNVITLKADEFNFKIVIHTLRVRKRSMTCDDGLPANNERGAPLALARKAKC